MSDLKPIGSEKLQGQEKNYTTRTRRKLPEQEQTARTKRKIARKVGTQREYFGIKFQWKTAINTNITQD